MALRKYLSFYVFIYATFECYSFSFPPFLPRGILVYPKPAIIQFVFGINVPSTLPRRKFQISLGYQANYELPDNISKYNPDNFIIKQRSTEDQFLGLSRTDVYKHLGEFLDIFEPNGHECLLKAICENAETPIIPENEHVLEDILHFILTPSIDTTHTLLNSDMKFDEDIFDPYAYAEYIGTYDGNCDVAYPDCEISVLDYFTTKSFV